MQRDRPETPFPTLNKRQRRLQERITEQYFTMSRDASKQAEQNKNDRIMGKPERNVKSSKVKRLWCPLDETELVKSRPRKLEICDVSKPRYKCTCCNNIFEGWNVSQLHMLEYPDVLAIVTEWGY